ncbi:MAG: HlyC/CorC family transporter, partial [Ruminococcus sp.]|nr:HlyC/CorC family transporter [Ruminococcus sp.]
DMLEQLDIDEDLVHTEYNSVGGWVTEVMEHIPEKDETAETGIFRLTASAVNEQTVEKVILEIIRNDD